MEYPTDNQDPYKKDTEPLATIDSLGLGQVTVISPLSLHDSDMADLSFNVQGDWDALELFR